MVHSRDLEEEFDLDKIDTEMRMEKIRQTASKLTWEGFSGALHRNLKEKRYVLDADGRIDLLQAISIVKKSLPIEESGDLVARLKQLSDSLECHFEASNGFVRLKNQDVFIEFQCQGEEVNVCKIGYFGLSPTICPEGKTLKSRQEFATFRSNIFTMISNVPSFATNLDHKKACVQARESVEAWLTQLSGEASFDKINNLPNGWFKPKTAMKCGRIYYVVEPSYQAAAERKNFDSSIDADNLPFLELSLVYNEKTTELPVGARDPWSNVVPTPACFCLRFSVPMIFSRSIWRKMERYLARSSIARQHVNYYRYTSRFDFKESELVLRTNLPSSFPQHCYSIGTDSLKDEHDVIIGDIYVQDMRNLPKIIALIRAQQMHNSLWESILSMCVGRWKHNSSIKMKLIPSAHSYEVQFVGNDRLVLVRFESNADLQWSATVEEIDGSSISEDVDKDVTAMLHRSRSIPCALTRVTSAFAFRGTPDVVASSVDNSVVNLELLHKVGQAWLPVKRVCKQAPPDDYVFEVENDPTPNSLLSSFKEVEETPDQKPARTEALTRTMRLQSDTSYAHAYDDMAAIFKIADAVEDGESKASTPIHPVRTHESSPHIHSTITQLSPLEAARQRMTHSVGAATAVGLATAPPHQYQMTDVFDFPADDRSVGSGSGSTFASPSPHNVPFGYPPSSPMSNQAAKRRTRARKSANIGDRTVSTDSIMSNVSTDSRKSSRGKNTVRRPRGPRKISNVSLTHADFDANRPMLQRSFSDYSTNSPLTPQFPSPSLADDSDDEECDPPPPPENFIAAKAAAAAMKSESSQPLPVPPIPPISQYHHPFPSNRTMTPSIPPPAVTSQLVTTPTSSSSLADALKMVVKPPQRKESVTEVIAPPPIPRPKLPVRKPVSDLYDDGMDSPPPPEERLPGLMGIGSSSSHTTTPTTTTSMNSPRDSEGVSKSESKLILKISKPPSRASPTVDVQKMKGPPSTSSSTSSSVKFEKKRSKEKTREREKSGDDSKRKRKMDSSKDREKDSKRHKSSTSDKDKLPPVLPFQMNSLKNFKIPKREEPKESPKEKEVPTPTATSAPVPLIPLATANPVSSIPVPTLPTPPSAAGSTASQKITQRRPSTSSSSSSTSVPHRPSSGPSGLPPHGYRDPRDMHRKPSVEQRRPLGISPTLPIPLPKGPPPRSNSTAGSWVRPPTNPPPAQIPPPRSPSPENRMSIDLDPNSPEDSLRIADD